MLTNLSCQRDKTCYLGKQLDFIAAFPVRIKFLLTERAFPGKEISSEAGQPLRVVAGFPAQITVLIPLS